MNGWVTVASVEDFAPGKRKSVEIDDLQIVVFNLDGQFYAIENVCSHDGGQIIDGTVEFSQIVCPRHGARFCLRTGMPLSALAYEPISTFPVRIENGRIAVRDNRWD